jgi:Na+/citrate or Na+/malate symporter
MQTLGVLISLASSAALFYYNGKDSLNVEFQIHAIEALLSSAFTVVVTLFPSGHMQSVTAFMAVSTFLQTLLSGYC